MTLEFSTNPRFADHGDIGACDTTSLRMVKLLSAAAGEGGDLAPPPRPTTTTRSRRPSPSAKKEAANLNDEGQQGGGSHCDGITASPSQISAVGAAVPSPTPPTQSPVAATGRGHPGSPLPGPELGSAASFQSVIIRWPACSVSPSCPEDASYTSAFCQEAGHTNAISDSSSKREATVATALADTDGSATAATLLTTCYSPLHSPTLSDGAPPLSSPTTTTTSPDAVVNNLTKTVNYQHKTCDIPTPAPAAAGGASDDDRHTTTTANNGQLLVASNDESFNHQPSGSGSNGSSSASATNQLASPIADAGLPAHSGSGSATTAVAAVAPGVHVVAAKTASLSTEEKKKQNDEKAFVRPVTGWRGWGGLRGGGGETTAIANNGTTGWGPPPPPAANNPGGSTGVGGGWGAAPPPANSGAVSAWGSPPAAAPNMNNNNGNANNNIGGNNNAAASVSGPSSSTSTTLSAAANGDEGAKQQQTSQQLLNNGIKASPPGMAAAAGSAQPTGSTSWAAAAGKGLPPSEPTATSGQMMNGATNKQLEQLNSVREALFSQDGWGGQHVKQDTSWDVGGALSEPATPAPPSKAESMQWQAPATVRNDGTDLWKSTLSGVPQAPKQQSATPWGNHTPAHPADYKTWGEPDEDPGAVGGDSRGGMPPPPTHPGAPSWGGLDDQQPPAWDSDRGPLKPKEDSWNANSVGGGGGGGQWNGRPGQEGGGGWGAPPPMKPAGGWSGQQQQQQGRDQPWGHHSESPTIGRRFDDGGWKDMPMPNMGSRGVGPPGPPSRLPPGALKPSADTSASPWGQPHAGAAGGRSWGDMEPSGSSSSSPWLDDRPTNSMGSSGWGGGGGAADVVGGGWPAPRKPMRSSPSWEEGPAGMGPDRGGWGSGARAGMLPPSAAAGLGVSKDAIWASKQFRILCDMGFRKEDIEVALRNTNLQLEDALEMLNAVTRAAAAAGGMRGGSGLGLGGNSMPPGGSDIVGFPVGPRGGGGGGGMDPGYDMRFSAGGAMPYPPGGGDCLPPGSNPSLQNNPSRGGGLNPALVQQMSLGGSAGGPLHPGGGPAGGPPRPAQSGGGGGGGGGPPSTSQLRLLVQQIQMAVQAGHLNAQILNQPLAPQTLLLLNQLLQQIKALAQCTQQHAMAVQATAGGRGGSSSSQALLHFNVQITKHKQQITNLQNQITAQQAQYLKNQQQQPPMGVPGGSGGMVADSSDLSLSLGNLSMDHHAHHQQQQQQQQQAGGGSKLTKWIKSDTASQQQQQSGDPTDFSRAPGTSAKSSSSSQQPSPNILLDPTGPWSNGNNGAAAAGGWPDAASGDKNSSSAAAADAEPDFGIPEFVPGKAWKGATIKDPSEDPTLTPGSVATTPILLQQQQGGADKVVSSSSSSSSIATTMMENSLGLASSTWSFGTTVKESPMQVKDGWGLPPVGRETNLTPMGQDLWGLSRPINKQPAIGGGPMADSGWPAAAATTNGWSNGINNGPQQQQQGSGSAWLLLRNLTAQIDGSTLRTLCMQHGPLNNFRLYLTHGIALVKYSNGSEAKKAQSALNNCVLGNTTILAEVAGEPEVESIVRTLSQQAGGGGGPQPGRGGPVQPQAPAYSGYPKAGGTDTWGSLGLGQPWPTTGLGGSVWGAPDDQHNRTTPLNSFLPPDLLSETM